jgi:hypothetical protein
MAMAIPKRTRAMPTASAGDRISPGDGAVFFDRMAAVLRAVLEVVDGVNGAGHQAECNENQKRLGNGVHIGNPVTEKKG